MKLQEDEEHEACPQLHQFHEGFPAGAFAHGFLQIHGSTLLIRIGENYNKYLIYAGGEISSRGILWRESGENNDAGLKEKRAPRGSSTPRGWKVLPAGLTFPGLEVPQANET